MEIQQSRVFVQGCFREEAATCECACPYHLDIRSFLKKMTKGRWPAAYRELSGAIAFPSIAARLCPRPCERHCQRPLLGDEALAIGELELACLRFAAGEKPQDFALPPKTQRVAVVGAGAAGLACALALSRKRYPVTVYDRAEGWGGRLRAHPAFPEFDADFARQFAPLDTEFRFGTEADEETLAAYDAVYVATGSPEKDFGLVGSWDAGTFTTSRPGWFLGGGVCGMPLMESVAASSRLSMLLEAYLQTGRAALIVGQDDSDGEGHDVPHPDAASAPRVVPADTETGYTKDEAKAEAARCMQCVCDACMTGCELMAHYRKSPDTLATQVCSDSNTIPPLSNCVLTRQTYSCNLCSRCADRCPEGIDLGALFRFSREDRWKQKKWIPGLYDYWLRSLDFSGGEGFYASREKCARLFFPGCQLTASCPDQVLAAWRLLRDAEPTGVVLGCCGASAVWAGDLERQTANLEKLRDAWESMGRPEIVTACATCADLLKKQLPEAKYVSLYELLDGMDAPRAALPFSEAAIFDPCAARRDTALHAAVASLAEKAGCRTETLQESGQCCGFGGHIRLANPALYDEIGEHRAAESPLPYIVYCANCLEVFRTRGKPAAHVLEAVFGGGSAEAPTLEEKRRNTLRVKGVLMEELERKHFEVQQQPWDGLRLEFAPEARANMEDKLITDRDTAEAIWLAEREQEYFTDETGRRCACLVRDVLTYWVDYRPEGGNAYRVETAYCHRMRIDEGIK